MSLRASTAIEIKDLVVDRRATDGVSCAIPTVRVTGLLDQSAAATFIGATAGPPDPPRWAEITNATIRQKPLGRRDRLGLSRPL